MPGKSRLPIRGAKEAYWLHESGAHFGQSVIDVTSMLGVTTLRHCMSPNYPQQVSPINFPDA